VENRYWLNTKTGETIDRCNESLLVIRKRTKRSRKILVPISISVFQEKNREGLMYGNRSFFEGRASRYHVSVNSLIEVWQAQNGECTLCGDKLKYNSDTHIDHIISKKQGGSDNIENFQFVCAKCNYAKRDLSIKEFLILCLKISNWHWYGIPKLEKTKIIEKRWRRESQERDRELIKTGK